MKNISENQKLYKSNELRSHIVPSTKSKPIIQRLTTTEYGTEYQLVIDGIRKIKTEDEAWTQLDEIKSLCKYLSFFVQKYPAKILFTIFKAKFINIHFLRKYLNISNRSWIERFIYELEENSLITQISKNHEDYNIIMEFWRNEFPNTRKKRPTVLYTLTEAFKPAIDAFSGHIMSRYFSKKELSYLFKFDQNYQDYCKTVKARLQKVKDEEKNAIGRCYHCNKLIRKNSARGKDYHKFNIGLICNTCKLQATKRKMLQWMHQNK